MLNLTEYRQHPDRLSDLLPWAALIAPSVVLNKDGSFQRTLQFRGPDLESSTDSELVSLSARLNNVFKRLGSGWGIYVDAERMQAQAYPKKSNFPDPISQLIDLEREELFSREQAHFESRYFLTLQYLPPSERESKLAKLFYRGSNSAEDYTKYLESFITTSDRLFDLLKDFMYEAKVLDDEQILTYLHHTISTKQHALKVPDNPMYLDALLADTPLVAGIELRLGTKHLRTVSVMGFPTTSVPAILDQLNHLPLEYRWMTRFVPLDKLDAEKILKQYKKRWFSKRKGLLTMLTEVITKSESAMASGAAVHNARDAEQALQELEADHVGFGYYTATITVWADTAAAVDEKVREVERVVNGLGFTTIVEKTNALEAWLSSLPGHSYANVRMPLMHSLNLSHLLPFSAVWAGPVKNTHLAAPPLFYARTKGSTPFRLVNHIGDVGHQMIIGPTGTGKSVLLNFMALQFLRYQEAQVFIFDKGGSFFASTLGVGGDYFEVGRDSKRLSFQPLRLLEEEAERLWAVDWVLGLLTNEKVAITPHVKEVVWQALGNLSALPPKQRTLSGLKALIQDQSLRQALERYTVAGPYGEVLDASYEEFEPHHWQCFELEALMNTPDIIPPVLNYIFHVLEKRFAGQPTLLILDEAWLFLDHPLFRSKIKTWLKTLRKLNVSVIFATQSVEDILHSEIASTLLESCPSRIFLPNNRALEPSVEQAYQRLGLNEQQINKLAQALPKRQYYFESNQGNCLFELELGPLALTFCSHLAPTIRSRFKDLADNLDRMSLMKKFLITMGLHQEVNLLEELSHE